jgi:hypothetical protein
MRNYVLVGVGLLLILSCAQRQTAPVENRAKIIQKRDMVPEPVALATVPESNLWLPINIAGHFPTAKECFDDRGSDECKAYWRYIETSAEVFIQCMDYQSSEATPRRCVQLYDMDGDFLVTMADWAAFDYAAPFRMWQLPRAK